MPEDSNLDPNQFINEIFSPIDNSFLACLIHHIRLVVYRTKWSNIPDYLNIHNSYFVQSIETYFLAQKQKVTYALEEGWIIEDEFTQYTNSFIWAEQQLLQQLFTINPNSFFLQGEFFETDVQSIKEKFTAIGAILGKLSDEISEPFLRLDSARKNGFPQKFDYALLERQQTYYEKISLESGFYRFNGGDHRDFNGWKFHLSVMHDDLEKAYALALPILLKKTWAFKVVDKSCISQENVSFMGVYGSKQFTIYLEEINGAPTISVDEIEEILSEIEKLFKKSGIYEGKIPYSDRALKYPYFSMRNDQYQNEYLSADEVGRNYNLENRENPYAGLLAQALEPFNMEKHLHEWMDLESQQAQSAPSLNRQTFCIIFFAMLNAYLTKKDYDEIILMSKEPNSIEKTSIFLTMVKFKDAYESPERHHFVSGCVTILNENFKEIYNDDKADVFLRKIAIDLMREFFNKVSANNDLSDLTETRAKTVLESLEHENGVLPEEIYGTNLYGVPIDPYERYFIIKGKLSGYPDLLKKFSNMVLGFAQENNEIAILFMLAKENKDIFSLTDEERLCYIQTIFKVRNKEIQETILQGLIDLIIASTYAINTDCNINVFGLDCRMGAQLQKKIISIIKSQDVLLSQLVQQNDYTREQLEKILPEMFPESKPATEIGFTR